MLIFPNYLHTCLGVQGRGFPQCRARMLGWGHRVDLLPHPVEMEGAPDKLAQEKRSQVGFYRGEGFSNEGAG